MQLLIQFNVLEQFSVATLMMEPFKFRKSLELVSGGLMPTVSYVLSRFDLTELVSNIFLDKVTRRCMLFSLKMNSTN